MNGRRLAATLIATLFCWLSIALVVPVTAEGSLSRAIVIVVAFWVTVELWLAWVRSIYRGEEKSKRYADDGTSLTLLLDSMSDAERDAVKQRLMSETQPDGEMSSLLEQLVAHEDSLKQGV
jgi:hypothetical protein